MSINNSGAFFNNIQKSMDNYVNSTKLTAGGDLQIQSMQKAIPSSLGQQVSSLNILINTSNALKNTVNELAMLNEQQTINMIKDLFRFPKQLEQLITQLTIDVKLTNQQTALLLLASKMDLSKLSQVLQNSSKEAMSNLYKQLASYNQMGVSMKDEQLSNLTKIISFISAASSSDVQSLKTTMLMYLPWLPLTDSEAFKLEIGTSNSNEENSAVGIDSIGVLMSTLNYGNIQAQILKTEQDGIKIEIISSQTFPLKDFVELMKQESKHYNININFDLAVKEAFNKDKITKTQTQVFLNTSPGVNPFLLLISNALIKNVHEIDIKESIRWQQKEIKENGKS